MKNVLREISLGMLTGSLLTVVVLSFFVPARDLEKKLEGCSIGMSTTFKAFGLELGPTGPAAIAGFCKDLIK